MLLLCAWCAGEDALNESIQYLQQLSAGLAAGDPAALALVTDGLLPAFVDAVARETAAAAPDVRHIPVSHSKAASDTSCRTQPRRAATLMQMAAHIQTPPLEQWMRMVACTQTRNAHTPTHPYYLLLYCAPLHSPQMAALANVDEFHAWLQAGPMSDGSWAREGALHLRIQDYDTPAKAVNYLKVCLLLLLETVRRVECMCCSCTRVCAWVIKKSRVSEASSGSSTVLWRALISASHLNHSTPPDS
jgi:hypothetical protein